MRILLSALLSLFILSCQREINSEDNPAAGTLKSTTTGDCLPITIHGNFKKDTALNSSNFIEVQAHFTSAGSFDIHSDTVSGFYFSKSGIVSDTGLVTIHLEGHGTPNTEGSATFTITFENSSCTATILVIAQPTSSNAVFVLGSSGSNCTGVTQGGTYVSGIGMNSLNTIMINVNVTSPGTYSITTTNNNGVSFSASGNFTTVGTQQVTLVGSGTPGNAGSFTYTITGGTSQCQFGITFSPPSSSAVFTTTNTSGTCNPVTINGTYKAGVPLMATNTITVQVNVTTPGSYSITTAPAVNGIVFNGAGSFSTTGLKNVTLFGNGTPQTDGTHTFTIAGPSGCSFDLTTQNNGGTATGTFTCKIDGVFTTFNINAHAWLAFPSPFFGQAIEITGNASASTSEKMNLDINRTEVGTFIVPGSYGQGMPTRIAQIYYYTPTSVFWYGISTINPITITITSITSTNVKGTFTGKVYDSPSGGGTFKTVTEGVFDVPVQ